jgi:hypothetical protein
MPVGRNDTNYRDLGEDAEYVRAHIEDSDSNPDIKALENTADSKPARAGLFSCT